jgi:PAT family beta-lactamase induction signal transducer AmpG
LSSLAAIASHTIGGLSGVVAGWAGWKTFYALCMLSALPSMALMLRLLRRYPPTESDDQPVQSALTQVAVPADPAKR